MNYFMMCIMYNMIVKFMMNISKSKLPLCNMKSTLEAIIMEEFQTLNKIFIKIINMAMPAKCDTSS